MFVVLPCFNEEHRLDPASVRRLAADPRIDVILVDDGSRDGTKALIERLAAESDGRVTALSLPQNRGKSEAVRAGMALAFERIDGGLAKDDVVGFLDADFATPPEEVSRLLDTMFASHAQVVFGSRIARLGARVNRTQSRHYLGRVFATAASVVLEMPIYDTQCGAKLFRDSATLRRAFAASFASAWVFDVELFGRLVTGGPGAPPLSHEDFREIPLDTWEDVRGSKLGVKGALRGGMDLLRLAARVKVQGKRAFFGPGTNDS